MSKELNELFLNNPQKFFKHHLIIENRLEAERPTTNIPDEVVINFEPFLKEHSTSIVAKRLSSRRKKLKPMNAVEIQYCNRYPVGGRQRGNFRPTSENEGINISYVPYVESLGIYRKLKPDVNFVFTHTLSGCQILTSLPGANDFYMMHLAGEASETTQERSISACFKGAPYRKISEPQYASFKGNWDFYAQGYDTSRAIDSKHKTKKNAESITHLAHFTWQKITDWTI